MACPSVGMTGGCVACPLLRVTGGGVACPLLRVIGGGVARPILRVTGLYGRSYNYANYFNLRLFPPTLPE